MHPHPEVRRRPAARGAPPGLRYLVAEPQPRRPAAQAASRPHAVSSPSCSTRSRGSTAPGRGLLRGGGAAEARRSSPRRRPAPSPWRRWPPGDDAIQRRGVPRTPRAPAGRPGSGARAPPGPPDVAWRRCVASPSSSGSSLWASGLAACSRGGLPPEQVQAWVGRPAADLKKAWGEPTREVDDAGQRVLIYEEMERNRKPRFREDGHRPPGGQRRGGRAVERGGRGPQGARPLVPVLGRRRRRHRPRPDPSPLSTRICWL